MKFIINNIEIIGFAAASLGMISLIPQVIKTWRSKSTRDVSLIMYLIICIDSLLWLTYGSVLDLMALITQSLITFTCAFALVVMKILWRRRK